MATEKHRSSFQHDKERSELCEISIASIEIDPEEDPVDVNAKKLQRVADTDKPWLGWSSAYAFVLLFFCVYRWPTTEALLAMYGDTKETDISVKVGVLALGLLEDVACATYFVCSLWVFDLAVHAIKKRCKYQGGRNHASFEKQTCIGRVVSKVATFLVSWLLFVMMMMPFVVDMILVRLREMRFSLDLARMAITEWDYIRAAPIARDEFHTGYLNTAVVCIAATVFATVHSICRWSNLSRWNPAHAVVSFVSRATTRSRTSVQHYKYDKLVHEENTKNSNTSIRVNYDTKNVFHQYCAQSVILLVGLIIFPVVVVAISSSSSVVVAYSAMNMSLNLLIPNTLLPEKSTNQNIDWYTWSQRYIHHQTEEYEQFGDNSLYRRTTGFHGDLAFDVNVSHDNPPNVMVIAVESFRFQDSRYLVGDEDPSNLFKGTNMTITPNFDRWAKRGVSFRNMWSSSPSSRFLESAMFAQVPRDDVVTAFAGIRTNTNLTGLPQMFTAKGYETFFTTGSSLKYDRWNTFLPAHGFDTVWDSKILKKLAQTHMNISYEQWDGPEQRRFDWGLHDDVSFRLAGDLLVNKTKEQRARIARGEPKKPMFLTHYTITSHEPFRARPRWYDEMEKPDFGGLFWTEKRGLTTKNYLEMRYFTDMELGKFMDRMERKGVLKDTIVVIVGDHGRAPELKKSDNRDLSVTRVPATIIAEGRLGKFAGLVFDDAVQQYDILNTLADITGVPEGGFIQDGVGRSLKRKIPFGERVVFSNNPSHKLSIVRGHQRLQYDRVGNSVLLHHADNDHDMKVDLFPTLTTKEQSEWLEWRDIGRDISRYFTDRWNNNCLLAVNCTST